MSLELENWSQSLMDITAARIQKVFPVEHENYIVTLNKLNIPDASTHARDFKSQKSAKLNGIDHTVPITGEIEVKDKETGKTVSKETVTLLDMPVMSVRGSFVVDGNEYSITHQIRRKPGVYSHITDSGNLETEVLVKGANFKIELDPEKGIFNTYLFGYKHPLYAFLKSMGITDSQMLSAWGKEIFKLNSENFKDKQIDNIKKIFETEDVAGKIKTYETDFGVMKTTLGDYNKGMGRNNLDPEVFLQASQKLVNISKEKDAPDERESMTFKSFTPANKLFSMYVDNTADIIREGILSNLRKKKSEAKDMVNTGYANSRVKKFFSNDLVNVVEMSNPLAIASATRKVSLLGTGAIDDENKVPVETRNLHPSQAGFIDPVHTPPARAGVRLTLAHGVEFNPSKGNIKTPILMRDTGKVKGLNPEEMFEMKIAFPDQFDDKFRTEFKKVRVIYRGKIVEVEPSEAQGRLSKPENMFSLPVNLIPFVNSSSGARVQMGANMQEQAISLKDREIPIVDTEIEGKAGTKVAADMIITKAPFDGVVTEVTNDHITIKNSESGKLKTIPIYDNFEIGGGSYIHESPVVKVGDKVKAGQNIAENNFTRNGQLALGKNLTTAYIPGQGYTFEDGFVLTEQGANKLTSQHLYRYDIPKDKNFIFKKDSVVGQFPSKYTKDQLDTLDKSGIARVGAKLEKGKPIASHLVSIEGSELGAISKKFSSLYKVNEEVWDKRYPGEVVEVHDTPDKYVVYVRADAPAQVGDKIAGRYGNKGVITRIIPNSQAPKVKSSGEIVDLILSPAGIPSRINPSQLIEMGLSKLSKKQGVDSVPVKNFSMQNAAQEVHDLMQKAGIKDKETIHDPELGDIHDVNIGQQYILKLEHQADKKLKARELGSYDVDEQPIHGGPEGAQSVSRLFFNGMLAHGARENMYEMTHLKSQKNDEFWRALKMGMPVPPPKNTPFAVTKFYDMLKGVGITNKRQGDKIYLLPSKKEEILKQSNGEVSNSKFIRGKDGKEIEGGLFDVKITGGLEGDKWSHVALAKEIPNPIFEGAIKTVLDLTQNDFNSILGNKMFYNTKTKSWDEKKSSDTLNGVQAMKRALGDINMDQEIEKNLKLSQTTDNITTLNKVSKKVRYLQNLKNQKMTTDVYFTDTIPVVPPKLRPIYETEGGLIQSPLNRLYSNLILYNNKAKEIKFNSRELDARYYKNVYEHVKGLYGLTDTVIQGREFKGILDTIAGSNPKYGFFQKKLIKKRQDLTARSVISLNPNLGPDEIGLSEEIAWKVYNPFVMRRMSMSGFNPLEAQKQIKERTEVAKDFLKQEVAARPALINREPTLHKYGIIGVQPILMPGIKSIQLSPMVTKGLGADFDGDTMSIHVPVSEKAQAEARQMFPTKHLIDPGSRQFTLKPGEDALMGLAILTEPAQEQSKYKFSSKEEASAFFLDNKIDPRTGITVNGKQTTFGREYVKQIAKNAELPEGRIDKKSLNGVLESINKNNPKEYGSIVSQLVREGNKFAYATGFSVGLSDIANLPIQERDKIFNETLDKVRKIDAKAKNGFLNSDQINEKAVILHEGKKKATDLLGSHYKKLKNNLFKMVDVGSRGAPSQLAQMMTTPMTYVDVMNRPTPVPIGASYSEGLPVSDYFVSMYGTRKGMVDSVLEVREPGYLGKQLSNSAMDNVISIPDCGTLQGVEKDINSSHIMDHFLSENAGNFTRGSLVTVDMINTLKKAGVKKIKVRSPLYCKAKEGTCQKCYGLDETGKTPAIGTNIGVLSVTAMTEPLAQGALSSKHFGGLVENEATGFPRIKQLTQLTKNIRNESTIAMEDGNVKKIENAPAGGQYIYVNDSAHYVPQSLHPKVKVGDTVKAGDSLSTGSVNPINYLEATKDIYKTRELMSNELGKAFRDVGPNLRDVVFESFVKSITNTAQIKSSDNPEVAPGIFTTLPKAEEYAAKNKVKYEPVLKGTSVLPGLKEDWMARLAFTRLKQNIMESALKGDSTDVHSYHPVPAWVHGSEFGKGTLGRY